MQVRGVEDVEGGEIGVEDVGEGTQNGDGDAEEEEEMHFGGKYEARVRGFSSLNVIVYMFMFNMVSARPGPVGSEISGHDFVGRFWLTRFSMALWKSANPADPMSVVLQK